MDPTEKYPGDPCYHGRRPGPPHARGHGPGPRLHGPHLPDPHARAGHGANSATNVQFAPSRVYHRIRFLVYRFAPHAPYWQFVLWARQLALIGINEAFESFEDDVMAFQTQLQQILKSQGF